MYFEEKLIKGFMCYRTDPNGEFTQYTHKELSRRYNSLLLEMQASGQQQKDED